MPTFDFSGFELCAHDDNSIISDVGIEIYRDRMNQKIGIIMTGPDDKWFGYGFGNDNMNRMCIY